MKKIISVLLTAMLGFGLAACSSGTAQASVSSAVSSAVSSEAVTTDTSADNTSAEDTSSSAAERNKENGGVLVVYFSQTGNTKGVAEKIASITGADIYEIKAAQDYTDADLDYNDSDSRATREQNDPSARPEIGSSKVSLEGYKTIYIGYPIWWGEEPRIMDTFVESYSFDGITMIPFCTSGSSGIGSSGKHLADNAGSGNWLDGQRFGAGASEDDVRSWIEGLQ